MNKQENPYQDRQLALQGTVRDCIHEILNKSRNETEARLGLDALQKVVNEVQKSNPQMKPTSPILKKIGSVVDAAMKSARRLSPSDVTLAAKGQVVHINFKGSATVEVTSIDDNMTLFNVEAIRNGDRTRMIHVSEAKVLQLLKDVVRSVEANADGSVEKAHAKGSVMEDIDADELLEAVLNRHEERILLDAFGGDADAMKHFQDVKSGKHQTPSFKASLNEAKQPGQTHSTETEKAKREATEKGELLKLTQLCKEEDKLFSPHVGFDGKLNFTGKFRRMENRGA